VLYKVPFSMKSIRLKKVEKTYQQELARLLLSGVNDPILSEMIITEVDLSPDLKQAKIYYLYPDYSNYSEKDVQKAIRRSKGFLKKELGARISLKYIPNLSFVYDRKQEEVDRIDEIFFKLDSQKKLD
jgi:ribosome-binding factor A